MKLSVFAKQMGVRYETAWRCYRDGKIRGHWIGAHTISINEEQFLPPPEKPARVSVYTRSPHPPRTALTSSVKPSE